MKMLGNAAFFFCLPFVLFIGAAYAWAFPADALAIVGFPVAISIAIIAYKGFIPGFEAGIQRRARAAERERQAQQQQRAAISGDLRNAMSPGYDPERSVVAPGRVAIKRADNPRPVSQPAPKPAGWASDPSVRNSPFFRS